MGQHKAARSKSQPGSVRIIGGQWRSRRLPICDLPGLRPSSDRLREMLFNWLTPTLPGSVCVDLFAGTGALGFEAASRGAAKVTLVELSRKAAQQLLANRDLLKAEDIDVVCADAFTVLNRTRDADIVFVDPPFDLSVQERVLAGLLPRLRAGALVYVESPDHQAFALPAGYQLVKEKRVAGVIARLLEKTE